jgi:hypothetical protein
MSRDEPQGLRDCPSLAVVVRSATIRIPLLMAVTTVISCGDAPPPPCRADLVAAGLEATWVMTADGTAWAWGNRSTNDGSESKGPQKQWSAVHAQELNTRSSICLLTTLGTLQCNGFAPLDVVQWTGVRSFASSYVSGIATRTVLAVKEDGTVWASDGEIWDPLDPAGGRQLVDLGNDVVEVTEGEHQGRYLARKTDGTVWRGPLLPSSTLPLDQVALPAPAVSVSMMRYGASFAALVDGSVYRISNTIAALPPELVEVSNIKTLVSGERHACGLTTQGTVWCWGDSTSGRLGLAPELNGPGQVVELGSDVTAISAGPTHTCARRSDASIWCWGDNREGQTTGSHPVSEKPTQVLGCQ